MSKIWQELLRRPEYVRGDILWPNSDFNSYVSLEGGEELKDVGQQQTKAEKTFKMVLIKPHI